MNLKDAKMYIRNAGNYIAMFGEELFAKEAEKYYLEDFSMLERVEYGGDVARYYSRKGYLTFADKTHHVFQEHKGEWIREVEKDATTFVVPDPAQPREKDLLRDCINAAAPFMKAFLYDVHHLDDDIKEVYVHTETTDIYVPIQAILAHDWCAVTQHMVSYWNGYYGVQPEEYRISHKEKAMSALATETAARLKAYFDTNATEPSEEDMALRKAKEKDRREQISKDSKDRALAEIALRRAEFAGDDNWGGFTESETAVRLMDELAAAIMEMEEI